MKTKILFLCLLYAGIWSVAGKTQTINHKVLKKYPLSVVTKVYNVVSKVPMDDAKQLQLAALYHQEDSALSVAFAKGAKAQEINTIRYKISLKLSNLLTADELEKFYTPMYQPQFMEVLLMKKKFGISEAQADSLKRLNDGLLQTLTENEYFDAPKYERKVLPRVLTDEQYTSYLAFKTKITAMRNTEKDWQEMIKFGIIQQKDSAKVYKHVREYNIARAVAIERYQDTRVIRNQNLRIIERTMPLAMQELERARKEQKTAGANGDTTSSAKYEPKFKGHFKW